LNISDEELDELLRALAHTERRFFLRVCWDKAIPAGELSEQSALSIATVSEHLKVLRKTGLINLEKDGRYWLYQTDQDRLKQAIQALKRTMDN
jgi:DNA-binding transcriptional ArsR family regulator